MTEPAADDRFLDEAVERGDLTEEQAVACRRILSTLREVDVALTADEIVVRKGFLSRAATDEVKRALARRRIGRYEVLERLGSGGSGVVLRARDTRLGRIVALKVLTRSQNTSDDVAERYLERFRREARAAVTLNHVNVVRGLDFGESDGYVYFAMEFVAGESLATRLEREGRLPVSEALAIASDVVAALAHVAEYGLVHRDVKPANVLVTPSGTVKLCDLGLARPETRGGGAAGSIAGTPLYVAPEQTRDPRSVDWRADVYGLGATLYHLLTGRPPFQPTAGRSLLHAHLEEQPRDPREHVLELSPSISDVVLKMLAKDPADRFASLDDLAADLRAVAEGRPPMHALQLAGSLPGRVEEILGDRVARPRHDIDEPAPGARFGMIATAAAGAAVVATALLVVFLADRTGPPPPPSDGDPEVAQQPDEADPAPAPADPEAADPEPDLGAEALLEAEKFARSEGVDLHDVIERYEFVADRYNGHASGDAAAAWLERTLTRLEEEAQREFEGRRRTAARFEADQQFGAAIAEYEGFPRRLAGTTWARRSLGERERLRGEARRRADGLEAAADEHLLAGRFDEAAAIEQSIRDLGLEEFTRIAERVQQRVLTARSRHAAAREEHRPTFMSLLGDVVVTLGDTGADAAMRQFATRLASDDLSAFSDDVTRFAADLDGAVAMQQTLRDRWTQITADGAAIELRLQGRDVSHVTARGAGVLRDEFLLGGGGESVRAVRVRDLTLVSLGRILGSPFDDVEEEERRARLVYLLSERNFPAASEYLALLDLAAREDALAHEIAEATRLAVMSAARKRLDAALDFLDVESAAAALAIVDEVLAELPGFGRAYTLRGAALALSGDETASETAFLAAVGAEWPDPQALYNLALSLVRQDRLADAEARLAELIERGAPGGFIWKAQALSKEIAAKRKSARVSALRTEAQRASRRRDTAAEVAANEQLLALLPEDPDALESLGRLYLDTGRRFDAFVALRTLALTHPDDERAIRAERLLDDRITRFRIVGRELRTRLRKIEGPSSAATVDADIPAYRELILENAFFREARLALARGLLRRFERETVATDLAAAEQEVRYAELLGPGRHETRLLRSDLLIALGHTEEALAEALVTIEERPAEAAGYLLAGRAHLAADRPDDAETAFYAAYERKEHAEPLYWVARSLVRQGLHSRARAVLTQLLSEHPLMPVDLVPKVEALRDSLAERSD